MQYFLLFSINILFWLILTRIFKYHKKRKSNQRSPQKDFSKFSSLKVFEILTKIKYNTPLIFSEINKKIITNSGVQLSQPIYVEMLENLDMCYLKNLYIASLIQSFHLVILTKNDYNRSILENAKKFFGNNLKVKNQTAISKKLRENLFNLNINFPPNLLKQSQLNNFKSTFLEVFINNNKAISKTQKFENYVKNQVFEVDNFNINVDSTAIEKQCFLKFKILKTISWGIKRNKVNLKIILKINYSDFDYFYIKKQKNNYKIFSILNNYRIFLNSTIVIKELNLSNFINKRFILLEINFVLALLENNQEQQFYLILNQNDCKNLNANIDDEIMKKIKEKFNFKIKTKDNQLDFYVNKFLPNKIIIDNLNNFKIEKFKEEKVDISAKENQESLIFEKQKRNKKHIKQNLEILEIIKTYKDKKINAEKAYDLLKNKFFIMSNKTIILNNPKLKNYKLEIFYNNQIKEITVLEGEENYVKINGVKYVNFNAIPLDYFSANKKLEIFFKKNNSQNKNFLP